MTHPRPYFRTMKTISLCLALFLSACQSPDPHIIRETEEFYINDRSHVLLNATRWTILTYSEELYEDSQQPYFQDNNISGTQVVIATHVGEADSIDTTATFNTWGIGQHDMGILITFFFTEGEDTYVYDSLSFQIGDRMAGYLSAFTASGLVSEYFNDPDISIHNVDQRIISLYFSVLSYIYLNVYEYETYDYQSFIDEYEANQYTYFGPLPSDHEITPLPWWGWLLIVTGILAFGIFPGRYIFPLLFSLISMRRGGGGRSRGYWFRR